MTDAAAQVDAPNTPAAVARPLIRPYSDADFDDVSRVCLLTADAGGDATGQYSSDDLMPDIFVRPYVVLEPRFAWVVESGSRARGYIVAAPDTRAFVERYREEWLPRFERTYARAGEPGTRDEGIRALGLDPERMLLPEVDEYPAHLHITLLPEVQGQGWGRALIGTLVGALRSEGVAGVHLTLAASNTKARAFYDRVGFHELPSSTPDDPALALRVAS
jgi:ribosomal protein S18 acetylase RimI-like enzyme